MSELLLSTLAMMGLTFVIGFFVAGVIKVIANWADFLDFYQAHRDEIVDLKKMHKSHAMVEVCAEGGGRHRKLSHRLNDTISGLRFRKKATA